MKEIDMAQFKVDTILKVEQDLNTSFKIRDKPLHSYLKLFSIWLLFICYNIQWDSAKMNLHIFGIYTV